MTSPLDSNPFADAILSHYRDTSPAGLDPYRTFFRASLTARTLTSGVHLYSWTEKTHNTTTGASADANPARSGTATISPAIEINNAVVATGTIVFMRQKGIVNGQVYYEFTAPPTSGPSPGPPTSLTVGTVTSGSVPLSWTPPTGAPAAAQYVVQYSTDAAMASPTTFTVTASTSTTVTGLSNGTLYYFGVYAMSSTGDPSIYSNIVSATPLAAPTVTASAIQTNGTDLVLTFSRAVSGFSAGAEGFALTGLFAGTTTLTYASGNGTSSITFTISRTVGAGESTGLLAYTAGDIVGTSDSQAMASFSGATVTNSSTQATVYSTAGTFSFKATATSHVVECWGPGGGGGGYNSLNAGCGGGGGEYRKSTVSGLTIGNTYTCVVPAGGTGGNTIAGSAGSDTTFNTTSVVAKSGAGGTTGTTSGGAGGTGGTGTTNYDGGVGAAGFPGTDGGGGGSSAGTAAVGGDASGSTGGTAPAGGGNGASGASGNGAAGSAPGGGGAGSGTSGTTGGAGAVGKIKVT